MDSIDLKRIDRDRAVIGELRLIGLFTSLVYMEQAARTPLLRRKLRRIVAAEDLIEGRTTTRRPSRSSSRSRGTSCSRPGPDELRGAGHGGAAGRRDADRLGRAAPRRDRAQRVACWSRCRATASTRTCASGCRSSCSSASAATRSTTTSRSATPKPRISSSRCTCERGAPRGRARAARGGRRGGLPHLGRRLVERSRRRATATPAAGARRLLRRALPRLLQDRDARPISRRCTCAARARARRRAVRGRPAERAPHQTHEGAEPLTRLVVAKLGGKMALSSLLPVLEGLGLTVVEEVPTRLRGPAGRRRVPARLRRAARRAAARSRTPRRRVIEQAVSRSWLGDAESDLPERARDARRPCSWQDVQILRAYRRYRQGVRREFTETLPEPGPDRPRGDRRADPRAVPRALRPARGAGPRARDGRAARRRSARASIPSRASTRTASCAASSSSCSRPCAPTRTGPTAAGG